MKWQVCAGDPSTIWQRSDDCRGRCRNVALGVLAARAFIEDKIYSTLWQSMVQWIISQQDLMPGQEIAIRPDRATFLSGDRATASVLIREPEKWNLAVR